MNNSKTNASAKDLSHLVGRPLVPFFATNQSDDDEHNTILSPNETIRNNSKKSNKQNKTQSSLINRTPQSNKANANMTVTNTQQIDWSIPDEENDIPIREFVDGYFVPKTTLKSLQANKLNNTDSPNPIVTPAKSQNRNINNSNKIQFTVPTYENPSGLSILTSSQQKFAAPAFNNSPSPMKIPMPKFLAKRTSTLNSLPQSTTPESINHQISLMHLLNQPHNDLPASAPIESSHSITSFNFPKSHHHSQSNLKFSSLTKIHESAERRTSSNPTNKSSLNTSNADSNLTNNESIVDQAPVSQLLLLRTNDDNSVFVERKPLLNPSQANLSTSQPMHDTGPSMSAVDLNSLLLIRPK